MPEQVTFKCLRCGHEFRGVYDTDVERMCPSVAAIACGVSSQWSVNSYQ